MVLLLVQVQVFLLPVRLHSGAETYFRHVCLGGEFPVLSPLAACRVVSCRVVPCVRLLLPCVFLSCDHAYQLVHSIHSQANTGLFKRVRLRLRARYPRLKLLWWCCCFWWCVVPPRRKSLLAGRKRRSDGGTSGTRAGCLQV